MPKFSYPVSIQSVTTDIQRLIDQARKEGYDHGYANCRAEVATRIATGFAPLVKLKKGIARSVTSRRSRR